MSGSRFQGRISCNDVFKHAGDFPHPQIPPAETENEWYSVIMHTSIFLSRWGHLEKWNGNKSTYHTIGIIVVGDTL